MPNVVGELLLLPIIVFAIFGLLYIFKGDGRLGFTVMIGCGVCILFRTFIEEKS